MREDALPSNRAIIREAMRPTREMARALLQGRTLRHADETAAEIGQHSRAAVLIEKLGELPRLAVTAELLLDAEQDGPAIEAIERVIDTARDLRAVLKNFKDRHVQMQRVRDAGAVEAETDGAP
jgi:hypothetical protein